MHLSPRDLRARCRGGFININRFVVSVAARFANALENALRAPATQCVRARDAVINGRKGGKGTASSSGFPLSRGSFARGHPRLHAASRRTCVPARFSNLTL